MFTNLLIQSIYLFFEWRYFANPFRKINKKKSIFLSYSTEPPRKKKTSLRENLAGSHTYNPIRDSRRDFLARKVSPIVSPKGSPRVSARFSARLLARLSARLLARLFAPKSLVKSLDESLGSDYMHDSRRDSSRLDFLRGPSETSKQKVKVKICCW